MPDHDQTNTPGNPARSFKLRPLATPEEFAAMTTRRETLPQPSTTPTSALATQAVVPTTEPGTSPKLTANPEETTMTSEPSNGAKASAPKVASKKTTGKRELTAEGSSKDNEGDQIDDNFQPMPYPKNGEVHFRIGESEWALLQRICKRRKCSQNQAINYVLRYHAHYPTDLEMIIDYLEVFDHNSDIMEDQIEELVAQTKQIEYLLRLDTSANGDKHSEALNNNGRNGN